MSSSTERKSPQNFITEMQEQITVAETAHPCVAVTEPNWKAMISTQRSQIDLLKEIRDTLPTLHDRERTESVYGSAAESTDAVHRADQRNDRTVPGSDGNIGGGTDREYQSADSGYRETGWENERELFKQHLYASQYGGGQAGEADEQDVLDISDSFGGTHSVGTNAAYLIGDISNMIDEDAPVKDCTTKHYPAERKKKQGPVMSGM